MVSRCMVARSWAIGTTSTVCARPSVNTRRASRSTPAGVVRCPVPTASTPGPSSSTSPPSSHSALGSYSVAVPAKRGWKR